MLMNGDVPVKPRDRIVIFTVCHDRTYVLILRHFPAISEKFERIIRMKKQTFGQKGYCE